MSNVLFQDSPVKGQGEGEEGGDGNMPQQHQNPSFRCPQQQQQQQQQQPQSWLKRTLSLGRTPSLPSSLGQQERGGGGGGRRKHSFFKVGKRRIYHTCGKNNKISIM